MSEVRAQAIAEALEKFQRQMKEDLRAFRDELKTELRDFFSHRLPSQHLLSPEPSSLETTSAVEPEEVETEPLPPGVDSPPNLERSGPIDISHQVIEVDDMIAKIRVSQMETSIYSKVISVDSPSIVEVPKPRIDGAVACFENVSKIDGVISAVSSSVGGIFWATSRAGHGVSDSHVAFRDCAAGAADRHNLHILFDPGIVGKNVMRASMKLYRLSELAYTEDESLKVRPRIDFNSSFSTVQPIIDDVHTKGDTSVKDYTARFDKVQLEDIIIKIADVSYTELDDSVKKALDVSYETIYAFHAAQKSVVENMRGVKCKRVAMSIGYVGHHVPGGTAVLPSTALMLTVLAQIAHWQIVVLATPPNYDGSICKTVLYYAKKSGITHVLPLHKTSKPNILSIDIHRSRDITAAGEVDTTAAGQIVSTLSGHSKKVTRVNILDRDDILLTGSADKTVRIWQGLENGDYSCIHILKDHSAGIEVVTVTPTNNHFVTASRYNTWCFYDLSPGVCLTQVADLSKSEGYTSAAFHPDGLILGTDTSGALVKIWDVTTGKNVASFDGQVGPVTAISFSENGYFLATSASDGVKLWDFHKLMGIIIDPRVTGLMIGTGAFQGTPMVEVICSITKHSCLILDVEDIHIANEPSLHMLGMHKPMFSDYATGESDFQVLIAVTFSVGATYNKMLGAEGIGADMHAGSYGYSYATYIPYLPATSPVPGIEGQVYEPQHYQYSTKWGIKQVNALQWVELLEGDQCLLTLWTRFSGKGRCVTGIYQWSETGEHEIGIVGAADRLICIAVFYKLLQGKSVIEAGCSLYVVWEKL